MVATQNLIFALKKSAHEILNEMLDILPWYSSVVGGLLPLLCASVSD